MGSSPIPAAGVRPEALDALALQGFRRSWNSLRPDLENQLSKLERFVSLCSDNGVQLTIATSPMIRENLDLHDPGMIDALAARIGELLDHDHEVLSIERDVVHLILFAIRTTVADHEIAQNKGHIADT